ncbi:hypothetical protein [Pseudogemmobacter faecipullorum]|uniref:Uncharacterized protein n=1 Tax=Pseudogemmobacter faecipullorum TaxID=2755041 RepID=A0ABS8CQ51_9RHOB|nr:hypothetical protein [Pseudogemmobacter faecipullorum]MCB5411488.1 hypothetical protein [Pseudogemmobacter faecipullorum]
MGQKWTTAHMLACRDAEGQLARVYHQIDATDGDIAPDERFVLGNGELVERLEYPLDAYLRENGETLSGPGISLA